MGNYTATSASNIEIALASVSGKGLDSRALLGWQDIAALIADHGPAARAAIDARTQTSMHNNVWTRAQFTVKALSLVDDLSVADGTITLATEVVYMAASKAGKGRSVAATIGALVKDGRRFSTVAALAEFLVAERKAATAPKVGNDEESQSTEKSEAERFADLLKAVNKFARDFDVNPMHVVDDLSKAIERDAAQEADEAADEAAMAA